MLLRLGHHYPGIKTWGARHRAWLANQKFVHPEQRLAIEELLLAERQAGERIARLEQAIRTAVPDWSLAPVVPAMQAMRGIDLVSAATILAEIGDLSRFENPRQLMAYLGLVPSERSTGESVKRGSITKAGNGRARRVLVEAAWAIAIRRVSATRSRHRSRPRRRGARDRLEGAGSTLRAVPHAVAERQEIDRGCHRHRARAGGLHLGHRSRCDARRHARHEPLSVIGKRLSSQQRIAAGDQPAWPAFVQRRGRSHGRGILVNTTWPIHRSTPASRPRQPRTNKRTCGIQPAHQSLITDVFGLRLRLCTIHSIRQRQAAKHGVDNLRAECLTWDIRVFWHQQKYLCHPRACPRTCCEGPEDPTCRERRS